MNRHGPFVERVAELAALEKALAAAGQQTVLGFGMGVLVPVD